MSEDIIEGKLFEHLNYTKARLPEAIYDNCTFEDCNFGGSDLSGCRFMECRFINCDLAMARLGGTVINDVSFTSCKLLGLKFSDCSQLLFTVTFDRCNLNLASFYGMKLKGIPFTDCSMQEADFADADMSGVLFDRCDLERAIFDNTNLEIADFRTASNYTIDPDRNRLRKARFSLAGITGLLGKWDIEVE